MQLNRGLSVWQKLKDFFHQILSFLWKGHNKRLRGLTINKAVTNQNHTEPKRTKTVIWNRALYMSSTLFKVALFIPWHPNSLYWGVLWVISSSRTVCMNENSGRVRALSWYSIIVYRSHNNKNDRLTRPWEGPCLNAWLSTYHYPRGSNKQLLLWKISSADN